jgi:hypothetical protein
LQHAVKDHVCIQESFKGNKYISEQLNGMNDSLGLVNLASSDGIVPVKSLSWIEKNSKKSQHVIILLKQNLFNSNKVLTEVYE